MINHKINEGALFKTLCKPQKIYNIIFFSFLNDFFIFENLIQLILSCHLVDKSYFILKYFQKI